MNNYEMVYCFFLTLIWFICHLCLFNETLFSHLLVGAACDTMINDSDEASMESRDSDDHMGEHAYSLLLPKVGEGEDYVLALSVDVRKQLDELLFEGDLLEVYLDEIFGLWKIMLASRDPEKECGFIDFDVSIYN